MPRPQVPDFIRTYEPPDGWTNVFALVPSNPNLYGTETLFGDWDGGTLLLAKDGAPTPVIRALRDKGDPQPWRHAQRERGDTGGYRTNESLVAAASSLTGGLLYGSATANLLCDDPKWSRSLPGFYTGPLHDYLARVLKWVLNSMPNVERVICLGEEAWFLTSTVLGHPDVASEFARYRNGCIPLVGSLAEKPVTAFAMYHPAARVSNVAKEMCWDAMNGNATFTASREAPTRSTVRSTTVTKQLPDNGSPDEWRPAPFARNSVQTEVRDSPIRAQMLAILKKAGETGASWQAFASLEWKSDFNAARVDKALSLLAKNNGYLLEYKGARRTGNFPDRWRLAPRQ